MPAPNFAGGVIEYQYPGDVSTFKAASAITGGQLVELTANDFEVQPAGADSAKCVGVALHNAATGEKLSVARVGIYYLTASGAVSGGDQLECAAAGAVAANATPTALTIVAIAYEDIANGLKGRCALRGL